MKDAASGVADRPASLARLDAVAAAHAATWSIADLVELTKVRVGLLVVFTTLAGYTLATKLSGEAFDILRALATLAGTGLVAGSAACLNQILERHRDARMVRTRHRPLAASRMPASAAAGFAALLVAAGLALLWVRANPAAAVIALVTWLTYAFIYTPLKTRTHLSTVVGAVPGALPPLIGWTAAGAPLTGPAWCLFGVLFFWQLPHFLAIAWLYRHDYARGGYPMLTVVDPTGNAAARQGIVNTLALIAVSLLPGLGSHGNTLYPAAALALGAVFLAAMLWLGATKSCHAARAAILVSIVYLPLLLVAMVMAAPAA